jgi:hypothetical protein
VDKHAVSWVARGIVPRMVVLSRDLHRFGLGEFGTILPPVW